MKNPLHVVALACAVSFGSSVGAQHGFQNFETGAVRPLATCTVTAAGGSRPLLLVCNTPADRLEIRDAVAPHDLITWVPTGLRPVTVRYHPAYGRAYVCNFLGDSVSGIELRGADDGAGGVNVEAKLLFTTNVGDEPTDIVFPTNRIALVSLRQDSALQACVAANMLPLGDPQRSEFDLPLLNGGTSGHTVTVKHPWMMTMVGGRIFVADHMDDNRAENIRANENMSNSLMALEGIDVASVDIDLAAPYSDWIDNAAVQNRTNGIGTAMHAIEANDDGSLLFVLASNARNEITGQNPLAALAAAGGGTGFVESWLRVVSVDSLGAMTVRGEHSIGSSDEPSVNLNRAYPATTVVPFGKAVTQPTGLAVIDGGAIPRLCITGFSSDTVAFLTLNIALDSGWDQVSIPLDPIGTYEVAGPRAAIYDATTDQVFVLRSLDNALTVFDASNPTGGSSTVALSVDPRPPVVLAGHSFLYSSKHSGNNTVSCSSCHVDARTDGLEWDLSDGTMPMVPLALRDRVTDIDNFNGRKGRIITQTFQGLLNFPVEGDDAADQFSNKPYHWRADRPTFESFSVTFPGLLSGPAVTATDMKDFRRTIDTILHPPNPEQNKDRVVVGDELSGLQVFCAEPTLLSQASCVHCHSFPDGSNNRHGEVFGDNNPLEVAAIRNLKDREAVLNEDPYLMPLPDEEQVWFRITGLTHDTPSTNGVVKDESINHFLDRFFQGGLTPPAREGHLRSFIRQWDTGTAPIVGSTRTLLGNSTDDTEEQRMANQVLEANADLVAFVRDGLNYSTYWYDVTAPSATPYRLGNAAAYVDFAFIKGLALNADSTVVLQSVPLGNGQFLATNGQPILAKRTPSAVVLRAMAPPTHMTEVAQFTQNWDLHATGGTFLPSVLALRTLQDNVKTPVGAAGDVGMNQRKVEPTRRFRVTARNIFPGATLVISSAFLPSDLRLPIYPTQHFVEGTPARIWETAVEADDLLTLALLNGGPDHPWVAEVLGFQTVTQTPPTGNAMFDVSVENSPGFASIATSQVLRIQDGR